MPRHAALALLVVAACGSASPPPTPFAGAFPDPGQALAPKLAVDAAGGHHLAAVAPVGDRRTLRYGYCAGACTDPARWAFLDLADLGTLGGSVELALDPSGHPRIAWVYAVKDESWYHFAACDAGCDQAVGWSDAQLWAAGDPLRVTRWLALDPSGNPRVVYADSRVAHQGAFLALCDSECASSSAYLDGRWREVQLSGSVGLRDFAVAIGPSGGVRIAARWPAQAAGAVDTLAWFQCDAGCEFGDAWSAPVLVYSLGTDGLFALALDAAGDPRLALYQGDLSAAFGDTGRDRRLFHAWCDGACADASRWSAVALGLAQEEGANGVDLVLDAQGRERIAFGSVASGTGTGLATCDQGCTGAGARWSTRPVETASALGKAEPRPVPEGYDGAGWLTLGRVPSVALDPSGAVRIASGAEHARWKGTPPVAEYDELRIRLDAEQR